MLQYCCVEENVGYHISDISHHQCIRTILEKSRKQQWEQHISSEVTHQIWGDHDTISDKLISRQLGILKSDLQMTGLSDTWYISALQRSVSNNCLLARAALSTVQCTVCSRPSIESKIRQNISVLKRQCTNNRVHYISVMNVICMIQLNMFKYQQWRTDYIVLYVSGTNVWQRVHSQHGAIQCPICHCWLDSKGEIVAYKCQPAKGMS